MTMDEAIVRAYLQDAHDKRGGWQMAMGMMADRLIVLEDKLLRAGVDFPTDPRWRHLARLETAQKQLNEVDSDVNETGAKAD